MGGGLPLLILIGAWLFSISVYAYLGAHNLDSDQSSEMVLAQLLNEEGQLLSKNWHYSTELRVLSPVPIYQLALLLFDSWHMARTFSIAVLLLGIALSLIYLLRSIGMKDAVYYAAACLVLPVSWGNTFILIYGQFYSVYFMVLCLLLGLFFRIKNGTMRRAKIIGLLLLSVWSGMQGVRMLMLCAAPLMLVMMLLFVMRVASCKTIREAVAVLREIRAPHAMLIVVGTVAGYLVNQQFFSKVYAFSSFSDTQFIGMDWNQLSKQINMIPEYLGFADGVQLISISGVTNAVALLIAFASLINLYDMFKHQEKFSDEMRLMIGFTAISVIIGIAFNCMTDFGVTHERNSISYYLPGVMFMITLAFARIEKVYSRSGRIRTLLLLTVCVMFGMCSVQYIRSGMKSNDADYEVRAQDLLDLGYTTGFATFWNANVLTEASDGVIDVYTYNTWGDRYMYSWLQKKEHFDHPHKGKVFVLIDTVEAATQNPPLAKEEHLLCETYNGWIYVYDSAQEVMDIQYNENTGIRENSLSE